MCKNIVFTFLVIMLAIAVQAQKNDITTYPKASFDSRDRIFVIDKATEEQVNLFPDIQNFKEAVILKTGDSTYVAEIKSTAKTTRQALDKESYQTIQAKTDQYLNNRFKAGYKNQKSTFHPNLSSRNGRPKLITASTTLAFAAYAGLIPDGLALGKNESTITGFAIGSAGFLIPFISTRHENVPMAAANLFGGGGGLGLWQGILLFGAIYTPQQKVNYIQDARNFSLTVAGVSLAEAIGGYYLGRDGMITTSQSQMIINNGLFASVAGLTGSIALDLFRENNYKVGLSASLVASVAGYYTGYYLGNKYNYSEGNTQVFNTAIPLTMLSAYSLAVISNAVNKISCGAMALAYPLGLLIANTTIQGCNFSKQQSNTIAFTTIAGGLFGLGAAKILTDKKSTVNTTPLITSLGAVAGFYLSYSGKKKEILNLEKPASANLKIDINPILTPKTDYIAQKLVPAVRLSYNF